MSGYPAPDVEQRVRGLVRLAAGGARSDNAVVVARVKERQDIDAVKVAAERDALRDEMLQAQRGTFFASIAPSSSRAVSFRAASVATASCFSAAVRSG